MKLKVGFYYISPSGNFSEVTKGPFGSMWFYILTVRRSNAKKKQGAIVTMRFVAANSSLELVEKHAEKMRVGCRVGLAAEHFTYDDVCNPHQLINAVWERERHFINYK